MTTDQVKEEVWYGTSEIYDINDHLLMTFRSTDLVYVEGQLIYRKRFTEDTKLDFLIKYEYNRMGQVEKEHLFYDLDEIYGTWTYEYAEDKLVKKTWCKKGNVDCVEENISIAPDGESAIGIRDNISECIYHYDELGQLIQVITKPYSGGLVETTQFFYTSEGKINRMVHSQENKEIIVFEKGK